MRHKPLLLLAFASALGTLAASLWWTYAGESPLALTLFFVGLAVAALLGFASGMRGEHRRWDGSPRRRGLLTALVALGATLCGALIVNFQTEGGQVRSAPPTGDQEQWVSLVDATAREAASGEVLLVFCDEEPDDGVVSCVVTFEGSRCQFWDVTNEDGQNHAAASFPSFYEGPGYLDPEIGAACTGTTPWPS